MTKKYHIDEQVNVLTGAAAEDALKAENDELFLSADRGIVQVSSERWQKAQRAERRHWMREEDRQQTIGIMSIFRILLAIKFWQVRLFTMRLNWVVAHSPISA
ncbi:MAG: hypothetical protein IPK19_05765 [Chloroflexi bacterium]|nr:hypothetical protein [Chloroflexota bacterium]